MIFPTPAAELAELAAERIGYERGSHYTPDVARTATRDMLADHARDLGVPAGEIEAAVEAAIKTATNTQ